MESSYKGISKGFLALNIILMLASLCCIIFANMIYGDTTIGGGTYISSGTIITNKGIPLSTISIILGILIFSLTITVFVLMGLHKKNKITINNGFIQVTTNKIKKNIKFSEIEYCKTGKFRNSINIKSKLDDFKIQLLFMNNVDNIISLINEKMIK